MQACNALLGIVPPTRTANGPPASAAALPGHLRREGLPFEFPALRVSSVLDTDWLHRFCMERALKPVRRGAGHRAAAPRGDRRDRLFRHRTEPGAGTARTVPPGEQTIDRMVFANRPAAAFSLAAILINGRAESAEMTPEEQAAVGQIAARTPGSTPLSRQPEFLRFWERVQRAHLWPANRPIHAGAFASDLRDVPQICLPKTVLARALSSGPGLVLANANSSDHELLDASLAPVLRWLSQGPRPKAEAHARLRAAGQSDIEAWAEMNRLARGGYLRPCGPISSRSATAPEIAAMATSPVG